MDAMLMPSFGPWRSVGISAGACAESPEQSTSANHTKDVRKSECFISIATCEATYEERGGLESQKRGGVLGLKRTHAKRERVPESIVERLQASECGVQ